MTYRSGHIRELDSKRSSSIGGTEGTDWTSRGGQKANEDFFAGDVLQSKKTELRRATCSKTYRNESYPGVLATQAAPLLERHRLVELPYVDVLGPDGGVIRHHGFLVALRALGLARPAKAAACQPPAVTHLGHVAEDARHAHIDVMYVGVALRRRQPLLLLK